MAHGDSPAGHLVQRAASLFFHLLFGPLVWAVHLTIVYATHTIACARGSVLRAAFGVDLTQAAVAAVTVAALALLTAAVVRQRRRCAAAPSTESEPLASFTNSVMMMLVALSAVGIAWAGLTALIVPSCSSTW
jgi:hypothetical protein